MPSTILIVDDDRIFREEFREFLDGYEVKEASSGEEALDILRKPNEIDLVILDVRMPGISGISVLNQMKKIDPRLGIIILTGHSSKDVAIEALKGRADDYLEKPLDLEETRKVIDKVLEKNRWSGDINTSDIKGKIEKVKRFIERNCFRKAGLEEAAHTVCLSAKYLSRVFQEQTGESFRDFRINIKLEKAKELLSQGGYNVNQVSEKLGYENTESFIRQFKKVTKLTPSKFRSKTKKTNQKKK